MNVSNMKKKIRICSVFETLYYLIITLFLIFFVKRIDVDIHHNDFNNDNTHISGLKTVFFFHLVVFKFSTEKRSEV